MSLYGPYAVVEKATGSMVGPVGLCFPIEWLEPEIKWCLARRFWVPDSQPRRRWPCVTWRHKFFDERALSA